MDLSEPSTFDAVVSGPDQIHWRKAIQAELESMRLRGAFRAAKLPTGHRAIGTKWVFKIKHKADGSIDKYKARLVAKGFKQHIHILIMKLSGVRDQLHRNVRACGQVRDADHGDCNYQVLRMNSRQA